MPLPNVIIAGPPKAGTTSVFRYLASHPDVCSSSIKEIHFFEHYKGDINDININKYKEYFKHCNPATKIRLEASPRYMQGGIHTAELIKKHIPDAKIIFILREPVERFISRYISLKTKTDRIPKHYHDLNLLIDDALAHIKCNPDANNPEIDNEIIEYLWQGCYAEFIKHYISLFNKENVCLLFFDDLKYSPKVFMTKLCEFIGIDSNLYNNYLFRVENKTRLVRYKRLHIFSEKLNRNLEFIQNKFPKLRRAIKSFYYQIINPESKHNFVVDTTYAESELNKYYYMHNRNLYILLHDTYPELTPPAWLR